MMPAPPHGDPRKTARLLASLVPDAVAKSISNAEFNDRIVEAARLSRQAVDPALSPSLRQAAKNRAQAVLRAQPRAVTEGEHKALIAKAAAVRNPAQANAIRRQAERLIEADHPPAPRRWSPSAVIAKAKADGQLLACFDNAGNLFGVADPDDVQPVEAQADADAPAGAAAPAGTPRAVPGDVPGAQGAQVVKASGSSGKQMKAVFDREGRLLGIIDPDDVQPVITSLPGGKETIAKNRAKTVAAPRRAVAKASADDDLVTVYDAAGRLYQVSRSILLAPEVQARNTGPVNAGGTTGMGRLRQTGPADALPADGPQRALPGDVPGRQVVKTAGETARSRRLAQIAKATGRDLSRPHPYARNPYSHAADCLCEAPASHRTHTEIAPGIPVDPRRVAKSSWSPGLTNFATEHWLAVQRRR
jgi:hypothetical protein